MDNDFLVSDTEMDEACSLAFELDESFRQKSEDYRNKYPDSQARKEEIADSLIENDTFYIKKWLNDTGQDRYSDLRNKINDYINEFHTGYAFSIRLTNFQPREKGQEDIPRSVRIKMPLSSETMKRAFEVIGLPPNATQDIYMIDKFLSTDFSAVGYVFKSYIDSIPEYVGTIKENINELNYLAVLLSGLDDIEKPVFITAVDKGLHCDDLADLINLAHNTEHYTLVPDIYSDEDAGRYFMDQQTLDGQTLNFLEDYIDYEKFGIDYADDNNCFLLDDGVLLDSDGGAAFHTEYDGNVLNIPDEMRITPIETEPEFIDEKIKASFVLAEELDRFFRHHNREYSNTYSDITQTQTFLSDCLVNGKLEFINKWLYDLGQDEGDALPIEVKDFENKYLQDKIREREENQMSEEKQEKITVLAVEPMAEPYIKEIDNTLESLQKEVGGLIQATYPYDDLIAIVCNDEGKINGLELNRAIYDEDKNMTDIIAGTFLIVGLTDESFGTLPDDMISKYKEMFKQPQTFVRLNNEIVAIPVKPSIRKQLNINKEQSGKDGHKSPEHKPPEL